MIITDKNVTLLKLVQQLFNSLEVLQLLRLNKELTNLQSIKMHHLKTTLCQQTLALLLTTFHFR